MSFLPSLAQRPGHRSSATILCRLVLVACFALPANRLDAHEAPLPTSPARSAQATALTDALLALSAQYAAASADGRRPLERDLAAAAAARRSLLAAAMEDDPGAVLDATLPAAIRSGMPSFISPYLEQDANVEGTIEILHEDRSEGSRYRYFLRSAGARLSLHFGEDPPERLMTGARVRVSGVQIDTMLALGSGKDVQQVAAAAAPAALGEQKTVVILVNFSDNPVQPYAISDARAALFGTTSSFFQENSYQQTWLSGDAYGWYTIPLASTTCDYGAIASYAQSAATAAGADLSSYSHRVYAFPQNAACGWWGLSSVGGVPSESWINGPFELGVLAHELGHGEGLWHSHALDCGASAIVGAGCAINEYGDIIDMMGSPQVGHYNAFQKERLGWLGYGASPPITTVLADGTYAIEAFEAPGSGPKALKILKSTDPVTGQRTWYYVESRQAIGFDGFLTNPIIGVQNVTTGVLIHTGSESSGNTAFLLDMTPSTPMYYLWYDPALAVGQAFTDADTGLTITTAWVNASGAGVTVKLGTAVSGNVPTVSVYTNQSSYTRGQIAYITVSVTANGSPVAKAPVSFAVIKPNGAVVSAGATTDAKGTATYKMRLGKQDPVGIYKADGSASVNGKSAAAETTFTVR